MVELTDIERIKRQKELIEELGNHLARGGGQQLCGRILGLLSFSDAEEFTFDEIVSQLQVSKSSVSVALNNLLLTNKVEYITRSGDRKRYFRVKSKPMDEAIEDMMKSINELYDLEVKAYSLKPDKGSRTAQNIQNMIQGISFFRTHLNDYKMKLMYGDFNNNH
ncbi:MAG: hypothetical protein MJZ61_08435 [Bacteroidales bacterium]|nr:hypothetical protein [Bacteroidales bacterium]